MDPRLRLRRDEDDEVLIMATFINLNETQNHDITFDKKGSYVVFFHNLSGKFIFNLAHSEVELDIFGLFTGKDADNFQIETIQRHTAPSAVSNLFIKGVFDDSSRFNYQGLIRLEKEAQQSHAYQKNQNLILSPKTFVESKPYLEILANDVFCTHGSTTGKINEDQMFYLKSRGISEAESKKAIVDGFVTEIIEKIKEKVPTVDTSKLLRVVS